MVTVEIATFGDVLAAIAKNQVGPATVESRKTAYALNEIVARHEKTVHDLARGLAGIYGRRFRAMGARPLHTAFGQVTASSIILIPVALLADRPWLLPYPGHIPALAIIALALFSTALAYVIFFRVLERAGATAVSLVTFMIPPSATALGAFFLGETLKPNDLLGATLIGLGLAAVDGRLIRKMFARSP